ncbi:MAG TPA: metallophosphoesterase [Candidatus Limnocylindria bacterium]
MKLLLFADLHLDAPFAWARPETARRRRANRRETLRHILALAEEERVDAVLCAGDLFEHDRVTPDTVAFLQSSFARTDRKVVLAPGNHDWLSPQSPYATVDWSPNVSIYTDARLTPLPLADGLTLWGAAHRAPANTDGFFAGFRPDRGGIHLALAHASESSLLGWQEPGKQPHAPFEAAEITAAGLSHAFLGHYHLPRDAERHTYPGNPDPLEFGEEGERGAVLVAVQADGSVQRDRRRVAVSEVHDLTVTIDAAQHATDVVAAVSDAIAPLTGCVRVTVEGELAPDASLELAELQRLGEHLDGLVVRAGEVRVGHDVDAIAAEPTVRGQFVRDATEQITDPEQRRRVVLTGLRALEGRPDLEVA